ncbi:coiled-coil domain-containing protein 66 [Ciona intestinalis]
MNIGDGLTIQTRSIGGKPTKGIFLLPHPEDKTKKNNIKPRNRGFPRDRGTNNEKAKSKVKINVPRPRAKPTKPDDDILFLNDKEKVDVSARKTTEPRTKVENQNMNSKNTKFEKPKQEAPKQKPLVPRNRVWNQNSSNNRSKNVTKTPTEEIKVDTAFVTLTQDQLNTILSLVKTKQDIDVAEIVNKKSKPEGEKKEEGEEENEGKEEDGIHNEPTVVPGLDTGDSGNADEHIGGLLKNGKSKSRSNSAKSTKDVKVDDTKTTPRNKMFDTLGGFGSRERDKDILEQRRQQWIKDLNEQVNKKKQTSSYSLIGTKKKEEKPEKPPPEGNKEKKNEKSSSAPPSAKAKPKKPTIDMNQINEDLPSAMRSSFFLGEAAPRDHAFSAKKKQQQQRWREELDKQLLEQKEQQAVRKMRHDEGESPEEGMWARHFDTMKPTTDRSDYKPTNTQRNRDSLEVPTKSKQEITSEVDPVRIGLDEDVSPRTNHLRTMTSLLDPAQIDAIELRRQKQQEHRRAITEQVEERQRIKREEERRRKMEEEDEERKLEEERMKLQNQFEREKNKQHAMEEKREKQTQHLYQQMQEAKASALKDKLDRREEALRNRGHDTSRLEKTHMNTLNIHKNHRSPERGIKVPSIDINDLHSVSQHSITASTATNFLQFDKNPVSVITNANNNGPIKLEISVNQTSPRNVVEAGSQTDIPSKHRKDKYFHIVSDDETEYLPLPYPSGRRNNERNNNDHEYDKYARDDKYTHEDAHVKSRKNNEKPKWGVGQKKKQYVPASKRYVNSTEWKERHESNVRRREEQLLAQQAMNERKKLLAANKRKGESTVSHRSPSPPVPALRRYNQQQQRERSLSPPKRYHDNSDEGNIRPPPRRNRSRSPPVPHVRNQLREHHHQRDRERTVNESTERPETAMSVTTDQAKYKPYKHSRDSPVPETIDFVEYRRSDVILDPNQPPSRPETSVQNAITQSFHEMEEATRGNQEQSKDPLINTDMVKQRERQDKILKEISILRQGLLLKQREVASYPVAMNVENRNLTERMNDVSMD